MRILDSSKNVFLAANCTDEPHSLDKALKALDGYGFTREKIRQVMDMALIQSGDYLIRCFEDKVQAWEIQFSSQGGFITKPVGNI